MWLGHNSLILAWLSLILVNYIPYYVTFRFYNGPVMSSDFVCYLGRFGCYTKQVICRSIPCYVCGRFVKDFNRNLKKDSFQLFFAFCPLQNLCLPILTITLQVNFYHINFIKWLYESEMSLDNFFYFDIMRDRDCFFRKVRHGLFFWGDF